MTLLSYLQFIWQSVAQSPDISLLFLVCNLTATLMVFMQTESGTACYYALTCLLLYDWFTVP